MKFKVAVISLLTAIMIICGYTGYRLVQEAEKQTEIQMVQARVEIEHAYFKIASEGDNPNAIKIYSGSHMTEIENQRRILDKMESR